MRPILSMAGTFRIFHTADWHLGQSFHGYDRDYEHRRFLDWLLEKLVERKPDALIVAGDVFDSVNPSAKAQQRLYDFLAAAHASLPALQIVLTAGNHDAAARLEAPATLLGSLNIFVIGTVARDDDGAPLYEKLVVPLKTENGCPSALVLAVPFLRPCDVPALAECDDAYLDGIRELYRGVLEQAIGRRARECPNAPLIAVGHCHLNGCAESRDSERRLIVGGAEALRPETFPETLAYVALGHLHQPQELAGGRIRYCGSPIPLSFSEIDYEHRILEVAFPESAPAIVTSLPVPKTASLLRIPADRHATLAEVLRAIEQHPFDETLPAEAYPFLEVRLLDDGPDPTRRRQVEKAVEGKPVRLATIKLEPARNDASAESLADEGPSLADLGALDAETIMADAYRERYGREPDAEVLLALREILTAEATLAGAAE